MRKSSKIAIALLVYVTLMAIYFFSHHGELAFNEKLVTIIASYVITTLLWIVLRKKEQRNGITDRSAGSKQNNRKKV